MFTVFEDFVVFVVLIVELELLRFSEFISFFLNEFEESFLGIFFSLDTVAGRLLELIGIALIGLTFLSLGERWLSGLNVATLLELLIEIGVFICSGFISRVN